MTPLERAWEHYGGQILNRKKAKCPLHEDRVASATVDLEAGKWSCHAGCGYGDVYDLIRLAEGGELSFPECCEIAARKFGDTKSHMGKPLRKGRKPSWV